MGGEIKYTRLDIPFERKKVTNGWEEGGEGEDK